MIPPVYITYDWDFDSILVSLYTFIKYNYDDYEYITVIENQEMSDDHKQQLSTITNLLRYIPTGKQVERFISSNPNIIDITGRLFEHRLTEGVKPKPVAIVVYVYYFEYWQQILNYIKKFSSINPVDIHVYLCDNNSPEIASQIFKSVQSTPDIQLIFNWTKNKGRDVRSFLRFIIDKKYKQYDYICKLHTKKTTYLDNNWREVYIDRLLSAERFLTYRKYLDDEIKGITSVDKYLIHEKYSSSNINYKQLKSVLSMYDSKSIHNNRYSFYAGTMFWCNNNFCNNINKNIDLKYLDRFEPEPINSDGSLAHAWERAFHII